MNFTVLGNIGQMRIGKIFCVNCKMVLSEHSGLLCWLGREITFVEFIDDLVGHIDEGRLTHSGVKV